MGFGYIIAGFLLLVNPIVHVVDLLPDFIGFFLICKGLQKLAYLHSGFSSAKDLFLRLAFVELIRCACIVFIPYTSGSALVLFSFVFGVVELIFFIPALNYLFEGLEYAGMRYDGKSVFAKKERAKGKAKEYGPSLKRFTLVFYILRVVSTLLPELTELQLYEYRGTVDTLSVDYTRFKPMFYILLGFTVVVVGVIWLVKLIRYFGRIRKDVGFIERLNEKYDTDIAVKTWIFMGRRMKTILTLFLFAVVLSLGVYIENINLFPGILSAAVLSVAAVLMAGYSKFAYAVLPFCGLRAVLSIVGLHLQRVYYIEDKFNATAVEYVERAADQYYQMSTFLIVENICAVISFLIFALALMKVVKKHLSETGIQNDTVQYNKANRDAETARSIGRKLLSNQIFMFVNCVTAGCYLLIMLELSVIVALMPVITVIWILQTFSTVSHVNELLYNPLVRDEV